MSLTFGFYNSVNGDRKYNATQFATLFDSIFIDGVFAKVANEFEVGINSGMNINVASGRAWFKKTWTDSDSTIVLAIDEAEVVLDRIDTVVIEINTNNESRTNSVKVIKGTPGSTPVAPTLSQSDGVYQYPLADIYVTAGATEILSGDITDRRGSTDCPFASGLLGSGQMLGSAATKVFSYNSQLVSENITVASNQNASAVGPITIDYEVSVTVETGGRLVIL